MVASSKGVTNSAGAQLIVIASPLIIRSPSDQTVPLGKHVELRVYARGDSPLTYQWFKNGKALVDGGSIQGTTQNHLRISRVTAGDAGVYSVRVTNLVGQATSSNAVVTVLAPLVFAAQQQSISAATPSVATANTQIEPPFISAIQMDGHGGVVLSCAGVPGTVYILQASSDLATWSNVQTNTAGNDGQWQLTDHTGADHRFYRLQTGP